MKKFTLIVSVILFTLGIAFVLQKDSNNIQYNLSTPPVEMPLVDKDPLEHLTYGGVPEENRNSSVQKWLSVSLKVQMPGGSGSATIIYYDQESGWAYVQSCGHLFSTNESRSADQLKIKPLKTKLITWYHNDKKLDSPKEYPAEVLYYSNPAPNDVSLMRFKPDWVPNYLPIAPMDFVFKENVKLHSCGCDGGKEVAHYDVRFIGFSGGDIITTENSPRPGRSGGGLMNDQYYVGICWGTSKKDGSGNGFFTPLATFRKHNEKNGYGWLNDVGINLARQIPIVDKNGPKINHPKDYIPLPNDKK